MVYDPAKPDANDRKSQSQHDMQENFSQANTLIAIDHVPFNDSTVIDRGKHTRIHMKRLADGAPAPTTTADEGSIYTQETSAGGRVELYYRYPLVGATPGRISQLSWIKAWCSFDGTIVGVIAIADGYNVTNVTRNGTGDYTINFTTALLNANYGVFITPYSGLSGSSVGSDSGVNARTVNNCRIFAKALSSNVGVDLNPMCVLIVGN